MERALGSLGHIDSELPATGSVGGLNSMAGM